MKLVVVEDIDDFLDSLSPSNKDHRLDLQCKISDIVQDLEKQIEKAKDGRIKLSDHLLSDLLDDLIFALQHPTFLHFFQGQQNFRFDFDSLVEIVPVDDTSEAFLKILHVLYLLPKDHMTNVCFQDGLFCHLDFISRIIDPRSLKHKWILDNGFEFRLELAKFNIPVPDFYNSCPLVIKRRNLVEDSIIKVMGADAGSLSKGVVVKFEEEDGIGDGVVRGWLICLIEDMVENFGAFQCSGDELAMDHTRIYVKQGAEEKYPDFFLCFGRLLALALIHEIQIGITLDRTIFQKLAENDINLEDIRETAPGKFKSYSEILLSSEDDYGLYTLFDRVTNKRITFEEREKFIAEEICADFVDCTIYKLDR
ncbi:E3 ubiquitin-protein ligase UPL5-like [Apium graveolens]|uniref:E3 ubiquitin-protein ligase UPL5-like n=1 Tax=Apium graveolens TaxID=4045 RepID=UPI003D79CB9A